MQTYSTENEAYEAMTIKNRAYQLAGNHRDLAVMVDGPGEGEFTVMPIEQAIDCDFNYEWARS